MAWLKPFRFRSWPALLSRQPPADPWRVEQWVEVKPAIQYYMQFFVMEKALQQPYEQHFENEKVRFEQLAVNVKFSSKPSCR